MIKSGFLAAILALSTLFLGTSLQAQEEVTETTTVEVPIPVDKGPQDALNRGTPRGSILGFLEACSTFDFEKAAEFLDTRNLPADVREFGGPELARQLNHVLSRAVWLDDYTVSDSPDGEKGDGLPEYRDNLVVVKNLKGEDVPLWMQHVPRGDGEDIWKVSNRSVALVPGLYEEYSYPSQVETIRNWFPADASFLGFEAFKWFILIMVALLCWPAFYLLGRLLTALFSSPQKEIYPLVRQALTGPLVAIAILVVLSMFLEELGAGAHAQQIMKANTITILVFVWALWSLINLYKGRKQLKLRKLGRPGAAKLMRPMTTFLKIVILIFATLFWLNNIEHHHGSGRPRCRRPGPCTGPAEADRRHDGRFQHFFPGDTQGRGLLPLWHDHRHRRRHRAAHNANSHPDQYTRIRSQFTNRIHGNRKLHGAREDPVLADSAASLRHHTGAVAYSDERLTGNAGK
jgi:hypothetical protein